MSISLDFAKKSRKRESQTISTPVPPAIPAVGDERPTAENGKVAPPRRVGNRERRTREHLTPQEVEKLITAARRVGRYGHRDATLILIAYRHGLRVSELVALRWDQIDFEQGCMSRGSRTEYLRRTRYGGRRYGRSDAYDASTVFRRTSSRPSVEVL